MLILRITIDIFGDKFDSKEFISQVKDKIFLINSIEPPDNENYNSLSIQNPIRVGLQYELEPYEIWYVEFIERYYDKIIKYGGENISLFFDVFYSEQCNFEIFNNKLMSKLTKFNISYPVSVYKTEVGEMKKILSQVGYTKEKIDAFILEG